MAFSDKLLNATHAAAKTDRLLSAAEAASLFSLQPGTMYDLAAKGQIPYVKLFGKTLRFRESVILKIIQDSEIASTNSPTHSDNLKRKPEKTNGATNVNHSQRRRGRGTEAVN